MDDDKLAGQGDAAPAPGQDAGASPDNQNAPSGAGTDQAGGIPKKFENSSREELAKHYTELEKKFHERDETLRQYRALGEWLRPYLSFENGNVDWDNNMLKELAKQRGLLIEDKPPDQQKPSGSPQGDQQVDKMELFERDPDAYLTQKLDEYLEQKLGTKLSKYEDYIEQDKNRRAVQAVRQRYPDFDKYRDAMAKIMTANPTWVFESPQQLEILYKAAKEASGGYVDKTEADQLSAMLQNTQTVLRQGGGQPLINDDKASNAQVMGLAGPEPQNKKNLMALFGTEYLDD